MKYILKMVSEENLFMSLPHQNSVSIPCLPINIPNPKWSSTFNYPDRQMYTKSDDISVHDTLNSHLIVCNTYQAICMMDTSHSTWRTYYGDTHHNVRVHRIEIQQTPHQMYPRMVQMDFLLLHYIHCHCP